jgi:hypothetical protein
MFRYPQTFFVCLIGLCTIAMNSNASAVVKDIQGGQGNDIENGTSKKSEPKKRGPKKRNPQNTDRSEGNPTTSPAAAVDVVQAPNLLAPPPLPPTPSPVLPEPLAPSLGEVLPDAPKGFCGFVKRLCHPLKGKYFFLNAHWKKDVFQNVVAYRLYVNGRYEKLISAAKKPCLQVLRHTRLVHKIYEISAVDKNGNESGRTPLVVRYGRKLEPLCMCRVAYFTTDFRKLTPEYLRTLHKERIIDLIQQLRKELIAAQDSFDHNLSNGVKPSGGQ